MVISGNFELLERVSGSNASVLELIGLFEMIMFMDNVGGKLIEEWDYHIKIESYFKWGSNKSLIAELCSMNWWM